MSMIVVTGYDRKMFNELVEKKGSAGCYLCKRDSEGIFLMKDGEEEGMGDTELHFRWFEIIEGKRSFLYALCNECERFLRAFADKLIFEREFGGKID